MSQLLGQSPSQKLCENKGDLKEFVEAGTVGIGTNTKHKSNGEALFIIALLIIFTEKY